MDIVIYLGAILIIGKAKREKFTVFAKTETITVALLLHSLECLINKKISG